MKIKEDFKFDSDRVDKNLMKILNIDKTIKIYFCSQIYFGMWV